MKIDGVKGFSATKRQHWEQIGEQVTDWIRSWGVYPVDVVVRQSSDATEHCLTITLFYSELGEVHQ